MHCKMVVALFGHNKNFIILTKTTIFILIVNCTYKGDECYYNLLTCKAVFNIFMLSKL